MTFPSFHWRRAWRLPAYWRSAWTILAVAAVLASCQDDPAEPTSPKSSGGGGSGGVVGYGGELSASGGEVGAAGGSEAAGGAGGTEDSDALCPPARTGHHLPARRALYEKAGSGTGTVMLVSQLIAQFDGYCSGCHKSPANQGDFSYSPENFSAVVDDNAIERIVTEDDQLRMPPLAPYPPAGALSELARLLGLWIDQGRPAVTFVVPAADQSDETEAPYGVTREIGERLTSLGTCIPRPDVIGTDADDGLDDKFAAVQAFEDLPKVLSETDLVTFDSLELARHGVLAFTPTYPLWTFDAGKLRMIRVPNGKRIAYDRERGVFEFPENTRYYKTFLMPVTDRDGVQGWRKMETRFILTRNDVVEGGRRVPKAVYGTYVWNDAETEATLLERPYFNGETFKDQIQTYVEDERVFSKTLERVDNGGGVVLRPLDGTKEYPLPGRHRCIQCHMGSESESFSIGFSPVQLNHRPLGDGGVYEQPGEDELTQAQRFIDARVLSGVKTPDDLLKLEETGGERRPRNAYELRAQAYMVGNCAFCHTKDGYPTTLNPSLEFFDLRPGGIMFGFPVMAASPLRSKIVDEKPIPVRYASPILSTRTQDVQPMLTALPPVAPWDSLIYRNVQAPRTYDEDGVLYPHMPLHGPSMDCRAPEIMGTWVASIPVERAKDESNTDIWVGSTNPAAVEAAERRVATFLEQAPVCAPSQDLRDFGAEAPAFTDEVAPFGIPDRSHFYEEDFTEVYGVFQPRGADFQTAMLAPEFKPILDFVATPELVEFVGRDFPFDFWQDKPECDFSEQPDFPGTPPEWMQARTDGAPNRVYSTLPGAATFEAICSNCHGARATASSNLASTIANLTGGRTRVANYAEGLFGPTDKPLANLSFFENEQLADDDETTTLGTDGAAKYMMWMALGGTRAVIPDAALRQVAAAKVASQARPKAPSAFASANMLEIAKALCASTIQSGIVGGYDPASGLLIDSTNLLLMMVTKNGEYLLYNELCAISNPRPVRAIDFPEHGAPVVVGHFERADVEARGLTWSGGDENPYCAGPDSLSIPEGVVPCGVYANATKPSDDWAWRGALNVGYGVYAYLKLAFGDPSQWRPRYDECEARFPAQGSN